MTAALVQARMSSSRLPGKVLMDLAGKPVLERVLDRCRRAININKIVVVTSLDRSDDIIAEFCKIQNVDCFRGSLNNVLDRYCDALAYYDLDDCVRITADCPMIEPSILDCVSIGGICNEMDYYGLSGKFPDGLDCTYFSRNALEISRKFAKLNSEHEHIGQYIENNKNKFKTGVLELFYDHNNVRLTLDTAEDFQLLEKIILNFPNPAKENLTIIEILKFLKTRPDVAVINSHILRNEGLLKSIESEL